MSESKSKYFILVLRIIIGAVFIYAAWGKLMHPADFGRAMNSYQMMPVKFIGFFAVVMPWIELISGTFLVFGILKKGSSFIILIMLFSFMAGLGQAWARGLSIDCGCFDVTPGTEDKGTGYLLIRFFQDLAMFVAALVIYIYEIKKSKSQNNILQNEQI
jgi:putative oxidoreductase